MTIKIFHGEFDFGVFLIFSGILYARLFYIN